AAHELLAGVGRLIDIPVHRGRFLCHVTRSVAHAADKAFEADTTASRSRRPDAAPSRRRPEKKSGDYGALSPESRNNPILSAPVTPPNALATLQPPAWIQLLNKSNA
ncbi:hypothetical protein ACFQDG_18335, partial [Natronoarchaeum mannanilyticum]|uniref:hypothetical protein n=1 Tax=Natronoarchaeum mannanilyticum TaxID=926360 RepID=UPI00362418E6